jgi:hypothetical protein
MPIYKAYNGPFPTTAAQAAVTTGTAVKTMLQVINTRPMRIQEWGISFDGAAAAAGIRCELLTTGTVAATVTAHVAAGLVKIDDTAGVSGATYSTTATGYTSTAEGTITATRVLDFQFVQPTGQYVMSWAFNEWPYVTISDVLRVRVTAAAAVNAVCFVRWQE